MPQALKEYGIQDRPRIKKTVGKRKRERETEECERKKKHRKKDRERERRKVAKYIDDGPR